MRERTISSSDEPVYTVTELTRRIKRSLERDWAAVWVEGELSNARPHSSGHLYFTVKDERAALKGVMFRSRARTLRFEPQDGQKVRVCGAITVYEPQGTYQINALRMEPVGVGDLELAFRQMYARLEAEGLFSDEHKQDLPEHPRTIGIVTSPTGAAIRDIFSVLRRRAPQVRLVVRPARVQGVGAADDVARAIAELDEWGECDLLIVGRGGGSLEDLWAFNEEVVARAIFRCRTPVISAVGHEIDTTIADAVADLRAPTPSAAAEVAVPDREELEEEIAALGERLAGATGRFLRHRRERVLRAARSAAFRTPFEFYRRRSQDTDRLRDRLQAATDRILERKTLRCGALSGRLDALSPLAILSRGYALVRDADGAVVRASHEVAVGARVEVRLGKGEISCIVDDRTSGSPESGDRSGFQEEGTR
ncbi:MAG: exodeoxyribonuclease VII large subunit [Gemmatimonadota bacterium]|nr:MAG: exodeoxyribonuclease VII large subunit [Gemmatimonadota bacterium]